jgi:hypothetical protein
MDKLKNKKLLHRIQSLISLRLGKRVSEADILEKCILFAYKRIETFISEGFILDNFNQPRLTKEIIERIRNNTIKGPLAHPEKSDDDLIYDL